MGVFYNTSNSQYRDFVLDLPERLMLGVVDRYNQTMDAMRKGVASILMKNYQTFSFAQQDLNRYVQSKYYTQLGQLVNQLKQNPNQWQAVAHQLQGLGYQLAVDEVRGTIASYTAPYASYQKQKQEYLEMIKKNPDKYTKEDLLRWDRFHYNLAENAYKTTGRVTWNEQVTFGKHYSLEDEISKWVEKGGFKEEGWSNTKTQDIVEGIHALLTDETKGVSYDRVMQYVLDMIGLNYEIKEDKNGRKIITNVSVGDHLSDVGKYIMNQAMMDKFNQLYAEKRSQKGYDEPLTQEEMEEIFKQAQEHGLQTLSEASLEKAEASAKKKSGFVTTRKISTVKEGGGNGKKSTADEQLDVTSTTTDIFAVLGLENTDDPRKLNQKVFEIKTQLNSYFFNSKDPQSWVNGLTNVVDGIDAKHLQDLQNRFKGNPLGLVNALVEELNKGIKDGTLTVKDQHQLRTLIDQMGANAQKYKAANEIFVASRSYAINNLKDDAVYKRAQTTNTYTNEFANFITSRENQNWFQFKPGVNVANNITYIINGKQYKGSQVNDAMIWSEINRRGSIKIVVTDANGKQHIFKGTRDKVILQQSDYSPRHRGYSVRGSNVMKLDKKFNEYSRKWLSKEGQNYQFSSWQLLDMTYITTTDRKKDKDKYEVNAQTVHGILNYLPQMDIVDPQRSFTSYGADDKDLANLRDAIEILNGTTDVGDYMQLTTSGTYVGKQVYGFKVDIAKIKKDKDKLGLSNEQIKALQKFSKDGNIYLGYNTLGSGGGSGQGPGRVVVNAVSRSKAKTTASAQLELRALRDPAFAYEYNTYRTAVNSMSEFVTEGSYESTGHIIGNLTDGFTYKTKKVNTGTGTYLDITIQDKDGNTFTLGNGNIPANPDAIENELYTMLQITDYLKSKDESYREGIDANTLETIYDIMYDGGTYPTITYMEAVDKFLKQKAEDAKKAATQQSQAK